MKIDPGAARCFAVNHASGGPRILRTNEQIEHAIGPERRLRIQSLDAPALQQHRLGPGAAAMPFAPTEVVAGGGVGAASEATTGTAAAAGMPSTRTISRRFRPATDCRGTGSDPIR